MGSVHPLTQSSELAIFAADEKHRPLERHTSPAALLQHDV